MVEKPVQQLADQFGTPSKSKWYVEVSQKSPAPALLVLWLREPRTITISGMGGGAVDERALLKEASLLRGAGARLDAGASIYLFSLSQKKEALLADAGAVLARRAEMSAYQSSRVSI